MLNIIHSISVFAQSTEPNYANIHIYYAGHISLIFFGFSSHVLTWSLRCTALKSTTVASLANCQQPLDFLS